MVGELQSLIVDIMLELQTALREELAAQGHVLTGNLSDSIQFEITANGREAIGQMYFEDYGVFVNVGVVAQNIPFGGGGTGRKGGTSKYIQGLIEFWEGRGLSGREAVGAAFATAHVHKREGMPSRASYVHTSTGERTGFVRSAIADNLTKIASALEQRIQTLLLLDFQVGFSENNKIRLTS